jgi:hypothetical protein
MPYRPPWFLDSKVVMSNAPTCGINKDGHEQFSIDVTTGSRSTSRIDDQLFSDAERIERGQLTGGNLLVRPLVGLKRSRVWVPSYYDHAAENAFAESLKALPGFYSTTIGELRDGGLIEIQHGHGSPSLDQRVGDVPYIKVSDLRAGRVNINPSNMIPLPLAKRYWKAEESGLRAYDLISPERASKNIGEFCVLMPGQEQVVLTKEVIVVRAADNGILDQFYLLWAFTFSTVRDQWKRVILMQTNREDVGDRFLEIRIPLTTSRKDAQRVSAPFREYFLQLEQVERQLRARLERSAIKHHWF